MYREKPSSIADAVLWTAQSASGLEDRLVVPDGCMDLIWAAGQLLVAGPDTVAHAVTWAPGTSYLGLRFSSGVGPRVFGVPGQDLRDRRVPLADLWPSARVRRLGERLEASDRPGALLEGVARHRLHGAPPPDPVAAPAMRLLARGWTVDRLAAASGLSSRQLYRRCLDAFGYGPKTLARILRFNHALDLGRAGTAPAEVAALSGYADQSHLARDVRSMTGTTFTALVA